MAETKLNRETYWGDRWPVFVYSPRDLTDIDSPDKKVIVHAGWGKSPKRLGSLMVRLADAGMFPVGIDTRWTYANQSALAKPHGVRGIADLLLSQPATAGDSNRFAGDVGIEANRYKWRRPTALLATCESLGITQDAAFVGHSEGGRVGTLAALEKPSVFDSLVIVNGAGLATSPNPVASLAQANVERAHEALRSTETRDNIIKGALDAVLYTATHPRRTMKEKSVILATDLWTDLGSIVQVAPDTDIHVLHATGDTLVPYAPSEEQAKQHPDINFTPTDGEHYNIYYPAVQDLIVQTLRA